MGWSNAHHEVSVTHQQTAAQQTHGHLTFFQQQLEK
jgi:hypothetical protein